MAQGAVDEAKRQREAKIKDAEKAAGKPATGGTKPAAKAKPAASTRGNYSGVVKERSALVKLVPGYKNPASPKQQDFMEKAFAKALQKLGVKKADVTWEHLLTIAGLYNQPVPEVKEGETAPTPLTVEQATILLGEYATSAKDRAEPLSTKPLKPLTDAVDDEAAIRPRHVAAALIAYGWQIDGSAAGRLEAVQAEKDAEKAAAKAEKDAAKAAAAPEPTPEAAPADAEAATAA